MSQNVVNYGIDPSGAQLLDELLSGEQQNRLTMDGGNSRPSYAEIGTIWTDKSVTGKATLKRFNGTSDDVLMTIDETTGAITIPGIADTDLSNLSASGNSKFQEPLVSGTNIKTVNNETLLGSGNISISAGANIDLSNLSATGNAKFQAPITGGASTITSNDLTASRALVSDANGKVAVSSITSTKLGYLTDVTSNIQAQIDGKVSSASPAFTGTPTAPTAASTVNNTQIATTAYVVAHRCTTAATTTSSASIYKPAVIVVNYKNGDAWYRKWSDGWIEQGGLASSNVADVNQTVNLNVAFTTTNYTVVASPGAVQGINDVRHCAVIDKTTTYFKFWLSSTKIWFACGY